LSAEPDDPSTPKRPTNKKALVGILGGILVVALAIGTVLFINRGDKHDASPRGSKGSSPASSEPPIPQDVRPGTCYKSTESIAHNRNNFFRDMNKVDCDVPHMLEVISTFTWDKAPTDRDDPIVAAQISSCWDDVIKPEINAAAPAGTPPDEKLLSDSQADVWYPTPAQIAAGKNTGYCVLLPDNYSYTDDDSDDPVLLGSLTRGTYRGIPTEAEAYRAKFDPETMLTCQGGSLTIDDTYSHDRVLVVDNCESIVVDARHAEILAQDVGAVTINGYYSELRAHGISNSIEISSDSSNNKVYWEVGDPAVVGGGGSSKVLRY
ncbi:MAG: hypothetical protein FWH11_12950, partial [Micrococcales bacterium]|nr:hypothetical protein [Micrococcales bacterium]